MDKQNIADLYPLSPMQAGMLFHSELSPHAGLYVEQLSFLMHGRLDQRAFARAWEHVIQRHAILRTCFRGAELKEPVQIVVKQIPLPLSFVDWTGLDVAEQDEAVQALLEAEKERGFDLANLPLFRLILAALEEEKQQIIWTFHHILLDGWSVALLLQDVLHHYEALQRGIDPDLSLPKPYRDYIVWLKQQEREQAKEFWSTQLRGKTAPTPLPLCNAQEQPAATMAEQELALPQQVMKRLQTVAQRNQLTMNTIVQGAWAIALSRYTNEPDVLFGVTVSGRPPALSGSENMVGLFINTLPARIAVDNNAAVSHWLAELQDQQLEMRRYEFCPLTDIHGWSDFPRNHPLFNSILVFENYPVRAAAQQTAASMRLEEIPTSERTNYPLTIVAGEADTLRLRLIYDSQRYPADTIRSMLGHLATLLGGIADQPAEPVAALPLLTPQEEQTLLRDWNDTAMPFPDNTTAHALFAQQAEATPTATALIFADKRLTYQELDQQANRLAYLLQERGVQPETLVGIALPRSPQLIVALLAVLKAGGAYLPLDPTYPPERLAFMLADAQAPLLLTTTELADAWTLPPETTVLALDQQADAIAAQPHTPPPCAAAADNLAYVIYTSGSTGQPKGTLLHHRGLCNLATAVGRDFQLGPDSRFLQFFSFGFDGSVFEIFGALLSGATLVLGRRETMLPGPDLARLLRQTGATHVIMPPSALAALPDGRYPDLNTVISGGEACPREVARRWSTGRHFFNAYGPTEITVACTWLDYAELEPEAATIPIGRAIANTTLYVVDDLLRPVPTGATGELLIGGAGVARGYLNRPELTAERFIPDPFEADSNGRLYRSGDLVRCRPDGNLEFLGRRDEQVKVRGFRIELQEVRRALLALPEVTDAAVIASTDRAGTKRLVAYLVPQANAHLAPEQLRLALAGHLPDYMIPSMFVPLSALPLLPNGKIDRRALPDPEQGRIVNSAPVPPADAIEERLAQIWTDVLGSSPLGVLDNFFDLGGHSLLALRIVAQIEKQFEEAVTLTEFYRAATIRDLARVMRDRRRKTVADCLVPLQPRGEGAPLFFIHPSGGSVHWYVPLARELGTERPFYGLQARGLQRGQTMARTIEEMAAGYVAAIRTRQPSGPYSLGSWSLGVIIAYEVAQQLRDAGECVDLLAMLDQGPAPPVVDPDDEPGYLLHLFSGHLALDEAKLRMLPAEERIAYIYITAREADWLLPDVTLPQFHQFLRLMRAQARAWRHYEPQPYDGHIILFRAVDQDARSDDDSLGWADLALGGFTAVTVPGDHLTMLQEPAVAHLAAALTPYLVAQEAHA